MCKFWFKSVALLIHLVFKDGIIVAPMKTNANRDWSKPASLYEVHSFIGLPTYYRWFIKYFFTIFIPMTWFDGWKSVSRAFERSIDFLLYLLSWLFLLMVRDSLFIVILLVSICVVYWCYKGELILIHERSWRCLSENTPLVIWNCRSNFCA